MASRRAKSRHRVCLASAGSRYRVCLLPSLGAIVTCIFFTVLDMSPRTLTRIASSAIYTYMDNGRKDNAHRSQSTPILPQPSQLSPVSLDAEHSRLSSALVPPRGQDADLTTSASLRGNSMDSRVTILKIPGFPQNSPMLSRLYIVDIVALPRDNAIAVITLGWGLNTRLEREGHSGEHPRCDNSMQLVLLLAKNITTTCHQFPYGPDGNGAGGSEICLCTLKEGSLEEELQRASSQISKFMLVQLNHDVVRISVETLTAASAGFQHSRRYVPQANGKSKDDVPRISVAFPCHGKASPYLAELLDYYWTAGVSHVYIGVFWSESPQSLRQAWAPAAASGFVTSYELDSWPGANVSKYDPHKFKDQYGPMTVLICDLALYFAKSFDDLLIVQDSDEMFVPASFISIPEMLKSIASRNDSISQDFSNLCFVTCCPIVTHSPDPEPKPRSGSMAIDFPFMDGGNMTGTGLFGQGRNPGDKVNYCNYGGVYHLAIKSISVLRNVYRAGIHAPGQCILASNPRKKEITNNLVGTFFVKQRYNPATGLEKNPGGFINVFREDGLVVQHSLQMFRPGRYARELRGHARLPSYYASIWRPHLKHVNESRLT